MTTPKEEILKDMQKKKQEKKGYRGKYTGWIIGRKLYDFDGKLKPFSYYPNNFHGKPPYWYKNKSDAMKHFKHMKEKNKFPGNQSNTVVVKFSKKVYLDRY